MPLRTSLNGPWGNQILRVVHVLIAAKIIRDNQLREFRETLVMNSGCLEDELAQLQTGRFVHCVGIHL
jgi:hypothetical protein